MRERRGVRTEKKGFEWSNGLGKKKGRLRLEAKEGKTKYNKG